MFLYRIKVEELDALRVVTLKDDIARGGENLHAHFPIREMSVVSEARDELDIYLALDDIIGTEQLRRLANELNSMIDMHADCRTYSRVTSELIHI